jgi:hypothetical protein
VQQELSGRIAAIDIEPLCHGHEADAEVLQFLNTGEAV